MRILVTGGTGFIGASLCEALRSEGHDVTVVTRDPAAHDGPAVRWDEVANAVARADAVVNLAGEPIAAGRWTDERKTRIRDSRIAATRLLVDGMAAAAARPRVLVSASAVGWYGPRGSEELDETAAPGGGFLADVCRAWEAEAVRAEELGVRVVRLRLGIVLAPDGGALAQMLRPFRFFAGGRIGDGRQWMSWIHRADVLGLVLAALAGDAWAGPVNATAPEPVTNADFTTTLSRVLARPAWAPVPAFVLRAALGEMADMLLTGQRVVPGVAQGMGYRFRYPHLLGALRVTARL